MVQLDTTMGPVTVELYYKHAPKVILLCLIYFSALIDQAPTSCSNLSETRMPQSCVAEQLEL